MATELWARNPHNYIREVVAGGALNVCWDWGLVQKKKIDPFKFSATWFPQQKWRSLTVARWGAIECTPRHPYQMPKALYPVWTYGEQNLDTLESYIEKGYSAVSDELRAGARWSKIGPTEGQENRVVVTGLPDMKNNLMGRFIALLAELQAENPQCVIHIHGLYSFSTVVGGLFDAGDFEPRSLAAQGKVMLPNGRAIKSSEFEQYALSLARFGYTTAELAESPSKRCTYNVKSHLYAAKNWNNPDSMTMNTRRPSIGDQDYADLLNRKELEAPRVKNPYPISRYSEPPMTGDKFYCDSCSYSRTCRVYRAGSICAVPDSEADELARHFKTRDSDMIIEGLGKLMEGNVERYVDGRNEESASGELNPHVTRIADNLFKQGVQLAKLVDPALRTPLTAVNIGANQAEINVGSDSGTKHQLAARIIGELEAGGVPRKQISEELVRRAMEASNLGEFVRKEAVKFALPEYVDVEEV